MAALAPKAPARVPAKVAALKPAPKPAAKPLIAANSPLLQPSRALSGNALLQSAQALTNLQTAGPLKALALQLAQNAKQGAAAQKLTAGYFNTLGDQAKAGLTATQGIGTGLNTQLQGLSDQTQAKIAALGQQAPGAGVQSLAATGLDGGSMANLASQLAQHQASSLQNAQTYQAAGLGQGANYANLAASNLGTYALRGQERLGNIAASTRLAAEPINQQVAGLNVQRGALLAKNVGSLRQQEIANRQNDLRNAIAQEGVQAGLTKAQIAAQQSGANALLASQTSTANAATASTDRAAALAQQKMLSDRTYNLDRQKYGTAQAKDRYQRAHQIGPYAPRAGAGAGAGGAAKPLTPGQNSSYWGRVAAGVTGFGAARAKGLSPAQIKAALTSGTLSPHIGPMSDIQAQAVLELWTYHYLNPQTAAALHRAGVRGGTYAGVPIQVGPRPPKNLQQAINPLRNA